MEKTARGRYKVLIVDDSEVNRMILRDMLEQEYEIIEAENGEEAIIQLRLLGSEISVVLLDIVMPKTDGFAVLDVMKSSGWINDIPVIMISAEAMPNYIERAFDLGVTDYISRPVDARVVRRRIENAIAVYSKQRRLADMVVEQVYERERTSTLMVEILSNIVEFRNRESGMHVLHMRAIIELLLKCLVKKTDRYQLNASDILLIGNASALHDIGKIAIPEKILNKQGKLTPEEYEIMKTHSAEGAAALERLPRRQNEPLVKRAFEICRWHHERYDGKGYPDGLVGEDIPISAQVVSLADVYDALTSERVYKPAYSHEESIRMIQQGECGVFNPLLLECLAEIADDIPKELARYSADSVFPSIDDLHGASELVGVGETAYPLVALENERVKYRFFSSVFREMQFEYTLVPNLLTLSERAATYLGLQETLIEPFQREELYRTFQRKDIDKLRDLLRHTTPEAPVVEMHCTIRVSGQPRWTKIIARAMWSLVDGSLTGAIGTLVDMYNEFHTPQEWERWAATDLLTGLYNQQSAKQHIERRLQEPDRRNCLMAVIDLDFFRDINEGRGHLFGDSVLKFVADRLQKSVRDSDIVARVGGDEFLLFLEAGESPQAQIERVEGAIRANFRDLEVSASIGVALLPGDVLASFDQLYRVAQKALEQAKEAGAGGIRLLRCPGDEPSEESVR